MRTIHLAIALAPFSLFIFSWSFFLVFFLFNLGAGKTKKMWFTN